MLGTFDSSVWPEYRQQLADEVDFHRWMQWLCDAQLETAQSAARDAGMRLGLMQDLAVGADRNNADAWMLQDLLVGRSWVIECDGREFHDDPLSYDADRARDLYLMSRGYRVTRLSWEQVFLRWEETQTMLLAILRRQRLENILDDFARKPVGIGAERILDHQTHHLPVSGGAVLARAHRLLGLVVERLELGCLLVLVGVVGQALLEALDALGHVAHQFGDLAAAEQKQHDHEHNQPVPY